jgi:hypothetical protein
MHIKFFLCFIWSNFVKNYPRKCNICIINTYIIRNTNVYEFKEESSLWRVGKKAEEALSAGVPKSNQKESIFNLLSVSHSQITQISHIKQNLSCSTDRWYLKPAEVKNFSRLLATASTISIFT